MRWIISSMVVLAASGWSGHSIGQICHVSTSGTPTADGASWSAPTAFQTALTREDCEVIRVAEGTYPDDFSYPNQLPLRAGVEVYGGYEGTPGSEDDPSARNPALFRTVIAGFYLGPHGLWQADTVIDGFVVTGGGIRCASQSVGSECSLTFRNMDFDGNTRRGLYIQTLYGGRASPRIIDSIFRNNVALGLGDTGWGASVFLYSAEGASLTPVFTNVTFVDNHAHMGAAVYANSFEAMMEIELNHVTITGNIANVRGAAIATIGEALGLRVVNSIIWGNSAPEQPEIYTMAHRANVLASVVAGGCVAYHMRCVQLSSDDPLLGALENTGGYTPAFVPGVGGSAIDSAFAPYCASHDQRGVPRPSGSACDRGAVESTETIFRFGFE